MSYPVLYLKKNEDRRLRQGHVWVFSNEVDCQRSALDQFQPGDGVVVHDASDKAMGVAYVNPNALICARLLSRKPALRVGRRFFYERLSQALALRQRLFDKPFYRWVFGESDGLPGLVIDRFGDVLSVQITTAGMECHRDLLVDVVVELVSPQAVLLKNDLAQRQLESLSQEPVVAYGALPAELVIEENGAQFVVDVSAGQKTGWFYDHRSSRKQFAQWSKGLRVLDLFSYAGAWSIPAAMAGAAELVCVDSSEPALALAEQSARLNGVHARMRFERADVFDYLKQAREQRLQFDAVILDPPALIKRKKDFKTGYEAYRRLNHLALQVLSADGLLVSASCSHHLTRDNLHEILRSSARHIDRHLVILAASGQGADHPVLPAVPETEYLKTFFCSVSSRL